MVELPLPAVEVLVPVVVLPVPVVVLPVPVVELPLPAVELPVPAAVLLSCRQAIKESRWFTSITSQYILVWCYNQPDIRF